MQTHALQLIPGKAWTFRDSLAAAPMLPAPQFLDHVYVHLFDSSEEIVGEFRLGKLPKCVIIDPVIENRFDVFPSQRGLLVQIADALPSRDVGGHERPRAEWIEIAVPALLVCEQCGYAMYRTSTHWPASPR